MFDSHKSLLLKQVGDSAGESEQEIQNVMEARDELESPIKICLTKLIMHEAFKVNMRAAYRVFFGGVGKKVTV